MASLCCSPPDSRDVRSRIPVYYAYLLQRPYGQRLVFGRHQGHQRLENAPLPQTTGQNVVQDAEMGNEIILLVNDSDKAR